MTVDHAPTPPAPPHPPPSRFRAFIARIVPALILAGATFAAYLPALQAGFIWDDDAHITHSLVLSDNGGLAVAWQLPDPSPTVPGPPQFYPVTHTSFWLEHCLWGMNPLGYHLDNILLHAASAILLWIILRRLGLNGPFLIAILWALHPVQVESVAWATERKNVLSLLFELGALLAYMSFEPAFDDPIAPGNPRRQWDLYALALLL